MVQQHHINHKTNLRHPVRKAAPEEIPCAACGSKPHIRFRALSGRRSGRYEHNCRPPCPIAGKHYSTDGWATLQSGLQAAIRKEKFKAWDAGCREMNGLLDQETRDRLNPYAPVEGGGE